MRTLETQIHIDATQEQVWAVLMDFPTYAEWNPFVVAIAGKAEMGARLVVRIAPPDARAITLKPRVTACEPHRHFAWLGHLGVPRIFDGEHEFIIEPSAGGGVTFTQRETFRGILVPLCGRILERTQRGFELMNEALKERAESDLGAVTGSLRDHSAQPATG